MKKSINKNIFIYFLCFSVLMFCLMGACSWAVSHETNTEKEKMMKSNELEQRGKQLRKAIDEKYKRLADAKALKIMGHGRNNITDDVIKYIPIGTSFDDAEAILRAAGFEVGKRDMNPIIHDYYGVYSVIRHYKLLTPLFAGTSVGVLLQPKNKDDWSTVQSLEADFKIVYP